MAKCNSVEIRHIYPNLNDQQQFGLNKIVSKMLSKYSTSFDYFGKFLIVLCVTSGSISIASFATITGAPVGIASVSFSLAFLVSTRVVKKLFKLIRNKKKKYNKIVMLARSKLNSMHSKICEALINNEISHEDFMAIINEEKNYRELNESIRMTNSQRSDTEKINLIKEGKKQALMKLLNAINLLIAV